MAALSVILCVAAGVALCLGSRPTPPAAAAAALFAEGEVDDALTFIVETVRLPRVLLAVLVGAALGVAGLILQALVRNPLASPDVIGITSGATAAAVIYLSIAGPAADSALLPLAALAGAGTVAVAIFALAWRAGLTTLRLVLIGMGMAAAAGAVTTLALVLNPDTTALRAYVWLTGSLYAARWEDVIAMVPWVAVLMPLALLHARHMQAMAVGDAAAAGLGVAVTRTRCVLLATSVGLAGAAVAFAGGLSFVGLLAPHLARAIFRAGFGALVWGAATIGAMTVLVADTVGRTAFLPRDLPAGIFVAGVGGAFFVLLLYRLRRN